MLTLLLALQLSTGTYNEIAAPYPLAANDSVIYVMGPDWSVNFLLNGDVAVKGDEAVAVREFWTVMMTHYPTMACQTIRERSLDALSMDGYFSVIDNDVRVTDPRIVDVKPWRVLVGGHGEVEITGTLPDRTRAFWIALGKELQYRCWQEPYR